MASFPRILQSEPSKLAGGDDQGQAEGHARAAGHPPEKARQEITGGGVDNVENVEKRGDKSGKFCRDGEDFWGGLSDFSALSAFSDFFLSSPD